MEGGSSVVLRPSLDPKRGLIAGKQSLDLVVGVVFTWQRPNPFDFPRVAVRPNVLLSGGQTRFGCGSPEDGVHGFSTARRSR